jgi:hypothetical protein
MKDEEDENDYIVLDGNRRLSALKILSNPSVLDGTGVSDSIKKSLKRAANGFNSTDIEPIRCALFDNRVDAKLWISRRHAGEDEGRGRITWGTLEKQRFAGDGSTLHVIDFIVRNADSSSEELENIKRLLKRNSTTLTRLLESSPGRRHLGITVSRENDDSIPSTSCEPKWVLGVLMKVIEDIKNETINTRTLNKEVDIENYLNSLPKELQQSGRSSRQPRPFREIDLISSRSRGATSAPTKSSATTTQASVKSKLLPKARSTLAPKKNPFNHPDSEKARQLLKEAGTLVVQSYRISAAFLLRAFVEFAVDKYLDDNGLPKADTKSRRELSLTQKADNAANHIEQNNKATKKQLSGFRKLISGNGSPISIDGLNAFVHQDYHVPAADALMAGWDASVPVFVATFGTP